MKSMKKPFSLTNEHGFLLPYVLLIILLVFIIVTANIKIYNNEIQMMEHMTEQIKVETLLQMACMKYKNSITNEEDYPSSSFYTFPSGEVKVSYLSHKKNTVIVRYSVTTDKQTTYSVKSTLEISSKINE